MQYLIIFHNFPLTVKIDSKRFFKNVLKKDWSQLDQEKFILDFLEIDWEKNFTRYDIDPEHCFDFFDNEMKSLTCLQSNSQKVF